MADTTAPTADPVVNTDQQATPPNNGDNQVTPPVESKDNKAPENIPYGRFSEEVSKRKAAEDRISKFESDQETARQSKLKEDGKLQELLDEQAPKVERAQKLETVVQKSVDNMMEKIPEDRQSLIPATLSPEDKLDYIHANFELLTASTTKQNVNHGTNPGGSTTSTQTFTGDQIADRAFYKANREEILLAQKEGRIKG